ncbi:MAG: Crp/Fnr family transcriptional regulator [Alphaproteobacteria bacterium]
MTKPTTILRQGNVASSFYVLIDGWGLRYKQLDDGRRQILSFLLPGDPVTLSALLSQPLTHSVQLLPGSEVSEFDVGAINKKFQANENLQACINATHQHEFAMADELVTNLGRRSAKERIAHLMLEFDARLNMRGAVHDGYILMPLRQRHLADALGLTTIHVNRTLRALRDEKLIDVRGGILRILDRKRLVALASFDDAYLYVGTTIA